ncbi:MAG: tetratricopeptide repeat protein, partial [Bryobacteraceae bacterium]
MSSMRCCGAVLVLFVLPALAQSPQNRQTTKADGMPHVGISIQQLESQARGAVVARNIDAAIADYQKLAQVMPHSAAFQDELGFLLAASKRTSESIEHFRRATEIDPKLATAWFHLGAALMLSGEQDAGIQALEKAVALQPNREDFRYRLGAAYNDAHKYAKAIPQLEIAGEQMGTPEAVWEALGIACQQQQKWPEARTAYEHALKLDPNNSRIRDSYGYVLARSGAIDSAIAQFREILRQQPE